MSKLKIIESDISGLIPDNKNFNSGNEYGEHLSKNNF